MFLVLFSIWIIFNGRITMEIVIFGIILSLLLTLFMCKFMNYKLKYDLFIAKKIKIIVELIVVLTVEIAKANEQMLYWIFSNKYRMEPVIVVFEVDLKTSWAKSIFANCITLTPGTITSSVEYNQFTVHCLDRELGKGLKDCAFVRVLRKLEDGNL